MRDLLTKLAPYLPYKIEIDVPVWIGANEKIFTGTLDGLYFYNQFDFECGVIQYSHDGAALEASYPSAEAKPHLFDFPMLTKPIQWQGKEVIPAVEIAKLALNVRDATLKDWDRNIIWIEVITDAGTAYIDIEFNTWCGGLSNAAFPSDNQVAIIDTLRSMHFAVGFEAGEFISKVATA